MKYIDDDETGLAFFYFDYRDQKHQHKTNVMAALMKQLAYQRNELLSSLETAYDRRRVALRPVYRELVQCFQQYREIYGTVILLFDAFDECAIQDDIVRFIEQFSGLGLSIFMTTRPNLLSEIQMYTRASQVKLTAQEHVIRQFIGARIDNKIPDDLKSKIQDTIARQADGMYLQLTRC